MRIHSQVHACTDEYGRFPPCQPNQERISPARSEAFVSQPKLGVRFHLSGKPRLVYDGVCNLCTNAARFLNVLDRDGQIQYVPSQRLGRAVRAKYGLNEQLLQGQMHLIQTDNSVLSGSSALADVCHLLFPFGAICNLFRTPLAQRLYSWIASRRYRLFGCRDSCYVVQSSAD